MRHFIQSTFFHFDYLGKFTGRSPKDKWIVLNKDSESAENIDWGAVNQVWYYNPSFYLDKLKDAWLSYTFFLHSLLPQKFLISCLIKL